VLARCAGEADAVVNAANAEHRGAAEALVKALSGSGKAMIQTSGSSIVADLAGGMAGEAVYDEDTPFEPLPGRANRVAVNDMVLAAAEDGVRAVVIAPTLIYGPGRGLNPDSIQIPWLVELAKKHGRARHIGPGENLWANVHIDDLVDLYLMILEKAPAGAFYYAENGENSMREACEAINDALGYPNPPESMTLEEASEVWGEGAAHYTMCSNSRVRARRARRELDWNPQGIPLLEDIAERVR
jgi:nucleoside-diphosphate-sugar epimerase